MARTYRVHTAHLFEPIAPLNSAVVHGCEYDEDRDVLIVLGKVGEFVNKRVRIPVKGNVKWYALDSAAPSADPAAVAEAVRAKLPKH